MVVEIKNRDELRELISKNKLVLIVLYDSSSPIGRYVASIADDVASVVEPVMLVAKADVRMVPDAPIELGLKKGASERLRLYIDGKLAWEQIGVFYGNPSADKYAIRRGILNALRSRNLSPAKLGLKLTIY